jgi:AraC-like DNA-binding protein
MEPTVSAKALRMPLVAASVRTGLPPNQLANELEIPLELLVDIDARVPHTRIVRTWDSLVEKSGDPHLGLFAAELHDAAPIEIVDMALSLAPTLRELLATFERFQSLFHEANDFAHRIEGDASIGVHRFLPGVSRCRSLEEFILATWARKGRRVLGPTFVVTEVRLRDPAPKSVEPFRSHFGDARLCFSANEDALVMPTAQLDMPLAGASDSARRALEQHLEQSLATRNDLVGRAKKALSTLLANGKADAESLAQKLAMSTRSLQRKLADHGTSFTDLLDEARRELSMSHLSKPEVSVTEVAFILGFSDLSAFSRAFRRWTGKSPIEYRRAS